MSNLYCESAQTSISGDNQGRSWEHFWLDQSYKFSNQIPNQESWTRTDPGWVLADNGYCRWQHTPPEKMRDFAPDGQALAVVENAPLPTQSNVVNGGMSDGGFGVLVLLAAVAAGALWWVNRGKQPDPTYHPHADLDLSLPSMAYSPRSVTIDYIELEDGEEVPEGYELVTEEEGDDHPKHLGPQGNSTTGIPELQPLELAGIQPDSPGIHIPAMVNSHPTDWPPKSFTLQFDPTAPEQEGEFDTFRNAIDRSGLNPRGNDVMVLVWGVKPSRGERYKKTRRRRDEFAKRLDYYRYEEA